MKVNYEGFTPKFSTKIIADKLGVSHKLLFNAVKESRPLIEQYLDSLSLIEEEREETFLLTDEQLFSFFSMTKSLAKIAREVAIVISEIKKETNKNFIMKGITKIKCFFIPIFKQVF